MKRPLLLLLMLLAGAVFIAYRIKKSPPKKEEVKAFLAVFTVQIKTGNTKAALTYFDHPDTVSKLEINVLSGLNHIDGMTFFAGITASGLDTSPAINIVNDTIATATFNITLAQTSGRLPIKRRVPLIITVCKRGENQYKIVDGGFQNFATSYAKYDNTLMEMLWPRILGKDTVTTPAIANAIERLNTRYDSVLYFSRTGDQAYYYVIKGYIFRHAIVSEKGELNAGKTYQMGLVDPQLREIIPPEFDLVHNIGGTIPELVEVEKDHKKGLFNLQGKAIVPVIFDKVIPLTEHPQKALLLKGNDYYYLNSNLLISNKLEKFRIAEILPYIKNYNNSFSLPANLIQDALECYSTNYLRAVCYPPSYLADLGLITKYIEIPNPNLDSEKHKMVQYFSEGAIRKTIVDTSVLREKSNWFAAVFYSFYDDYLGGRQTVYQDQNLLMVDKKQNRILSYTTPTKRTGFIFAFQVAGLSKFEIRALNETLWEFKGTNFEGMNLPGGHHLRQWPEYKYLYVKNNQLVALPDRRVFGFTKYMKMDETYLRGSYRIDEELTDQLTPEMLEYARNEIYASYRYRFKDAKWERVFERCFNRTTYAEGENKVRPLYNNVDDSLTAIDKYNIDWINKRLIKSPV